MEETKKSSKSGSYMTVKVYVITLVVLAVLVIGIPFLVYQNSFHTTLYLYTGIIVYFALVIGILKWIGAVLRKTLAIQKVHFLPIMTVIIVVVSVPVIILSSIIATGIIMIWPRSKYAVFHIIGVVALFVLGVRVKYTGNIPRNGGPFIITPNHTSFIDYVLIPATMGARPWNVVAGSNLQPIPMLGYFIKKYAINIDRTSMRSGHNAWHGMVGELKCGKNVAIFPEGGRLTFDNRHTLLKGFKDGPFRAAVENGISIMPIVYSWPMLYVGKGEKRWWVTPQTIEIIFLDPVSPTDKTVEELMEETRSIMLKTLKTTQKVREFQEQ